MLGTSCRAVVSPRTLANGDTPRSSGPADDSGMTTVPTPSEQLLEVRRGADRLLGCCCCCTFRPRSASPRCMAPGLPLLWWVAACRSPRTCSRSARRAPSRRARFIALALPVYGALFVDQSHGLIEMHFYFFASLAFLLVYRDWRLIVIAAGAIAVHHLLFMVLQQGGAPVWVMPAMHLGLGMVLLHAVFVVFESSVLIVLSRSMEEETLAAARMRVAGRRRARRAGDAGRRARAPRPLRDARQRRGPGRDPALRYRPGRLAGRDDPGHRVGDLLHVPAGLRGLRRVRARQ